MTTPIESAWVVLAAALVLLVQAGLATREAGLTRSKNALNVAAKALAGAAVTTIVFWVCGYGLLARGDGPWVGTSGFMPSGADGTAAPFFLHLAMCGAAAAIAAGAVAERLRLVPWLVVTAGLSALVYPVFAHWALPGGWLAGRGFVDVGGAATVHALGGWVALAGVLAVGARAGRFPAEGEPARIPGSSAPLAALGVFLAWFGWLGGLAGGALVRGASVAQVVANGLIAAAAGGAIALALAWSRRRAPSIESSMTGLLAGLVAVSAGGHAFTATGAVLAGGIAGALAVVVERALERARLDDAVGAVPVHLVGGVWGALAAGIFADPALLGAGLSRGLQIKAQLEGVLAGGIFAFAAAFGLFKLAGAVSALRPSADDEGVGLNVVDHDEHSEMGDLLDTMEEQARTGDMTVRAPVEPFTEFGQIALQYNRAMETLQFITAQTESLVHTSLDGLLTFNTEGIITSSNPAASAIFGYSDREFRNVSITSVFAPSRDKAKGRADLQALLKTFVGQTREVRGQRRNGEEFTMEASFNYVSVGVEEIYTATFRDITQRKETEAQLARAQAEIRRRLEQELEDAKVVQRALLPTELTFPGCDIARHYQSASETGGDWFGYHHYPDASSITFYIGDVTGHGLPAALLSGVVCGAVYSAEYTHHLVGGKVDAERQLRNIADVVNRIVLQTGKGEFLMTMAFLHVNLRSGQLSFLNAGHNHPYMLKGQSVSTLVGRGSRLGETPKPEFDVVHTKLDPGDTIVLYTDGLVENQGPDGKVLSVRDVKGILAGAPAEGRSAADIRDELVNRAMSVWRDHPVADDHSVLVFRWTPPAQGLTAPAPARAR